MKRFDILKKRFTCLFLAGVILTSLTGCTGDTQVDTDYAPGHDPFGTVDHIDTGYEGIPFSEYEPGKGMETHIDTDYEGPSLGEYINEGLADARENGLYTDPDYSDIGQSGTSSGTQSGTQSGDQSDPRPNPANQNEADAIALERFGMLQELAELEYEGEPYVEIHDNVPYFSKLDMEREPFESYSELDDLGRVGPAFACLHQSLMPEDEEERGDISSVKPTGWVQAKYEGISNGGWLYNRCHLIAWSLAGENANEENLMAGTRYFNIEGMLPFEMQVLNYLDDHEDGKVLYRAQPVFKDDGLLAKGLLLEAKSMDDEELEFCVYIFNVQPGIKIDYQTGESRKE